MQNFTKNNENMIIINPFALIIIYHFILIENLM